jgi:hypothetical protein
MKPTRKTFLIVSALLCGIVCHAANWFVLDFAPSPDESSVSGGQYGIYSAPKPVDSTAIYAGSFCPQGITNIVFDADKLQSNPAWIMIRFEVGTNSSPFSQAVYFNTNDYPILLGASGKPNNIRRIKK